MSSQGVPSSDGEQEELTIQQVSERHKGWWVGILVTKRDKNLQPVSGRVVAADPDRYRLRESLTKYTDVCILYAGEPPYPVLL
ncbi:MAG: hypothetical protein JRM80_13110 [Nitrososphaerota archaeon]|nr:hypothetical protein [Nitrososphaerota archaeon]